MAQYQRPQRGSSPRRNDDEVMPSPLIPHTARDVSRDAQNTINNIDNVLGAEDDSRRLYNPSGDSSPLNGEQLRDQEQPSGSSAGAGDSGDGGKTEGASSTTGGESSAAEGKSGEEPVSEHNKERTAKYKNLAQRLSKSKNARRTGIAVLAGSGVGTLGVLAFLGLSPLKVTSMVNMLKNASFAASDDASSKMDDQLLQNYIVKKVIPGMQGTCKSTRVNKSCAVVSDDSTNLVTMLYHAWRDNNLEGKMATDFGFEIRKEGNTFYVLSPQLTEKVRLGQYDPAHVREFDNQAFVELNRSDVRKARKDAFRGASLADKVHYKFSVGRLLERKYGIRRCLTRFSCKIADKIDGSVGDRKLAFQRYFAERVLQPRTEMERLVLQCAFSGFDCAEPQPADQNGERRTKFESDTNARLLDFRAQYGDQALKDLAKESDKIAEKGFTHYMITKLADESVADVATKAIPVVGWIVAFAAAIKSAANAGPAITHMQYVMTSTSSVALASMYATSSSEQQLGLVDPVVQGSIGESLDEQPGNDQNGASMEASNLAQQMTYGTSTQTASLFDLFSPRAYADSTTPAPNNSQKRPQICDDGQAEKGLTCPEMMVGALSTIGNIANVVSQGLNSPQLKPLVELSKAITAVVHVLQSPLNWILEKTHLDDAIASALGSIPGEEQFIGWIQSFIMKNLFLQQYTEKSSAARRFEGSGLGFTVMAQDDCRYNMGCGVVTPAQSAAINNEIYAERQADFKSQPLYARLFNKNDSQSLVSHLALVAPGSTNTAYAQMASFISNPFQSLSASFSSIFVSPKAKAQSFTDMASTYGLKPLGYPIDSPVFTSDPEEFWQEHDCGAPDMKQHWGDQATQIDPNTGETIPNGTQPCMLIRTGISDSGGVMDTSLLDSGGGQ
jgi:hypothetical protein